MRAREYYSCAAQNSKRAVLFCQLSSGVLPAARARAKLDADAMNPARLFAAAAFCAAVFSAPASAQADYAREKRLADEVVPGIVVGDAVWLEVKGGRRFLAIHAPAPQAASGVVLAHGLGLQPDWG